MAVGLARVSLCPGVARAAIEGSVGAGLAGWDDLHKLAHREVAGASDSLRPFELLPPSLAPSPVGVIPVDMGVARAAEKAPSSDAPATAAGGRLAGLAAEGAGARASTRAYLWLDNVLRDPGCPLELDAGGKGTRCRPCALLLNTLARRAKREVEKRGHATSRFEQHVSVAGSPGRAGDRMSQQSADIRANKMRIKQLQARVQALMDRDAVQFDADNDEDAADLAELASIVVAADEMTEEDYLREAAESAPAAAAPAAFATELGSAPAPAGTKKRMRAARGGAGPISASAMDSIFDSAKGRKTDIEISKAVWRLTAANARSALKNKGMHNGFRISLHPAALQFAIRLRLRCGLACYDSIADVFLLPSSRSLDKVINAGDALESGVMKTLSKKVMYNAATNKLVGFTHIGPSDK
ncbi:hypothetical protein T492DRAFT_1145046, partial [Pavlovales sp. CCMP2436]